MRDSMVGACDESSPVFVNLSNHPSDSWGRDQLQSAEKLGRIIDYSFPQVDPEASAEDVRMMARSVCKELTEAFPNMTVMVQGEFTLTYHLVRYLKEKGIRVVAGCTERRAQETVQEDGAALKTSVFRFVQFRDY